MGNQINSFLTNNFPCSSEWVLVQKPSKYYSNYVKNQQLLLEGENYRIGIENVDKQFQLYLFRKQNPQQFVTVYDIVTCQQQTIFYNTVDCMITSSSNIKYFDLILQRIPYRLSDLGVLTFNQMIYILEICLKSLQKLWIKFGKCYQIDQNCICFNTQGKCKIWINQNLKQNSVQVLSTLTPLIIIKLLFQMLQDRVIQSFPQNYLKMKKSSQIEKFSHALSQIQKIKKRYQIHTNCIESLTQKIDTKILQLSNKDQKLIYKLNSFDHYEKHQNETNQSDQIHSKQHEINNNKFSLKKNMKTERNSLKKQQQSFNFKSSTIDSTQNSFCQLNLSKFGSIQQRKNPSNFIQTMRSNKKFSKSKSKFTSQTLHKKSLTAQFQFNNCSINTLN